MIADGKQLIVTTLNMAQLPTLVKVKAAKFELDPKLVAAVILQESAGKPWRTRYEPGFYRRHYVNAKRGDLMGHVPNPIPTLNTELVHRATSWGLMQILGETARGQDFEEDDMPLLLLPEVNIELGCRYLRHLIDKDAHKSVQSHAAETKFFKQFLNNQRLIEPEQQIRAKMALLRYNGGGNLAYPDEVWQRIESRQYTRILES